MSRLRNRIVKAEFWTDPDLLSWPRDKRFFYLGLRALAEDSGCNEDSPFGWMCVLYPSPLDRDITLERVTAWRDELISDGKLIPYESGGKRYLYQTTFHDHERPRNPQPPTLPLPVWVRYGADTVTRSDGRTHKMNRYVIDTSTVPARYQYGTELVPAPQSSPVQSSPELKQSVESASDSTAYPADEASPRPAKRVASPTPEEWEKRAQAVLESFPFPSDLVQLGELLAAENKTGKASLSRIVRSLYEPLAELASEVSTEALRHGLRAAIVAGAPNHHYVRKAASGYRASRAPAGNSAAADLSDYDREFLTT